MSLTPAEIVAHLDREGALAIPDTSPWPTVEEGADMRPVDWGRLLPRNRPQRDGNDWDLYGDDWQPRLDEDFLVELEERSGRGEDALAGDRGMTQPDVCAWYQPLHFHGLDWGIYIREDCLRRIATGIAAFLPRPVPPSHTLGKALIRAAFNTLYLHEAYHHKTESLAIRLHIVERKSCYVDYFRKVYDPLRASGSNALHEEALANAESYSRLSEIAYRRWLSDPIYRATLEYLRWRFPHDPPGYNQAGRLLTPESFDRCEWQLKSQVQEQSITPYRLGDEWRLAPRINQSLFNCRSDIWTIVAPGVRPILPTSAPYPSLSTRALEQALRAAGYDRAKGGKGSHIKLSAPGEPTIILPGGRKDLSPVVMRNVARALGYRNAEELRVGLGL